MPPMAIPVTLYDSLMARLDRLGRAKVVAQIGACIGREFSYELIAALAVLDEHELQRSLDQLVATELVFRRGSPLTRSTASSTRSSEIPHISRSSRVAAENYITVLRRSSKNSPHMSCPLSRSSWPII